MSIAGQAYRPIVGMVSLFYHHVNLHKAQAQQLQVSVHPSTVKTVIPHCKPKPCPAHTWLIMSWEAFQSLLTSIIIPNNYYHY